MWCWDVTWLPSCIKGKYYYLYMIMDMFSRKVVAWCVYTKEDSRLAKDIFARALHENNIKSGQLTVHADNGAIMKGRVLLSLFDLLCVTASYSRPHTSNDNAFAESVFSTFKGRVLFPESFLSLEGAMQYCNEFFRWYNEKHLHSGLDYLAPSSVHKGAHHEILDKRNANLEQMRKRHPSRHGSKKKYYKVPEFVELKHKSTIRMAA